MKQLLRQRPIFLLLSIFLLGGLLFLFFGVSSEPKQETSMHFKVVVKPSKAEVKQLFIKEVGITKPSRSVGLYARTNGMVEKVLVKEGQFVKSGTPLLKIEEEDRRDKVRGFEALVAEKQARYNASEKLAHDKFRSLIDVATNLTELEKAKAYLKMARLDLGYTEIKAPFDGLVKTVFSKKGRLVSLSGKDPAIQMVDLDPLRVIIHVNERHHRHLALGSKVEVSWEGIPSREGTVTYIAPVADYQLHTFLVKVTLSNPGNKIPGGITTTVQLPVQQELAHEIESGSLILSDEGVQGVRVVDHENKVQFLPVKILSSTAKSAWVYGLPEEVSIITVGQGFVREGEKVTPTTHQGA